jgi:Spy/CpxP family protein refolding chaperone
MTRTQAQILELFQTLDQTEKRALAEQLYETAVAGTFYDRMTREQRAQLQESIEQADRGEGLTSDDFFRQMAAKHGLTREP